MSSHVKNLSITGHQNVKLEVLQTYITGFGYILQGVARPQLGFEQDLSVISNYNGQNELWIYKV